MRTNVGIRVIEVLLGLLFAWAAMRKIMDPYSFLDAVYSYNLLPVELVPIVAGILPWLELVPGLSLVLGIRSLVMHRLIVMLLALFIIAQSTVVLRGLSIECACFGVRDGSTVGWISIARSGALLAIVSVMCVVLHKRRTTHHTSFKQKRDPEGVA